MKPIKTFLRYLLYAIALLSFPNINTYSQSRFAKIEKDYVVIYEMPALQFSDRNRKAALEIERFPRQQSLSYRTTEEAIERMIEIGYKIRTVASLFLPSIERYSNLLGVHAPGLFSLQFGYTPEHGFNLYFYCESQLGCSLYDRFMQKYRFITDDMGTIYLMNAGRYNLQKRSPLGF